MNMYQQRRNQLAKQLATNSLVFVFAGTTQKKSADAHFLFEVNRNFYYLTGIDEQEAVLVLHNQQGKTHEMLFIRDVDPTMEKWNGLYMSKEQAKTISNIETISYLSSFEAIVGRFLSRSTVEVIGVDHERINHTDPISSAEAFAKEMQHKWLVPVMNVYPMIAALRTIKNDHEVERIKAAIDVTNDAFLNMLQATKSGKYEYQLQAEFEVVLKLNNAKPSFDMIVAASDRACILHYVTNLEKIEDNALILTDMGANLDHYCSDISRTFPSNGKFTEKQKELYNVVLEAMQRVFDAAKPGVTLRELNQIVVEFYQEKLVELDYIASPNNVVDVYYHGVSHFLGLDVHDVGQVDNMKLQAGHIITVEPGVYIAKEKIGIRIEDDLLITKDGNINLSSHIIKSVDEIEQAMKNK
jgi:Xaa-Pro aminopeptidase